jgi:hypothetical protein
MNEIVSKLKRNLFMTQSPLWRWNLERYFRKSSVRCIVACFSKIWTNITAAAEPANGGDAVTI